MQKKAGVILSYLLIFFKIIVTFFYIPFVLGSIGKDKYGLFTVVSSIIAYIAILDFGLNDSTLRYFVKFKSSKDSNEKNSILSAVSKIYTVVSILMISVIIVIYLLLDEIFLNSFTVNELVLLKKMYLVSGVSIFFTIFFNPISAILNAHEKFIFLKSLELISFFLTTVVIVIFLKQGYGVYEMVLITASVNILILLLKYLYCLKTLKINFPHFRKSNLYIKELLYYGSPIFVVIIVEQIYWKLDNILIGSLLGTTFVTYYAMGVVFQKYILSFSTAISRIMTPNMISQIDSSSKPNILNEFIKISRLQLIIISFISLNLILWGREFLVIWLGKDYEQSYAILILIMIPFTIENIGNVRNIILQVYKLYWLRAIIILIISILNIAATYILLNKIGLVGAALSTALSLMLGYIFTNILLWKKVKLKMQKFFINVWLKAIPIYFIISLAVIVSKKIYMYQVISWFSLIFCVVITGILYSLLIWFFYLNKNEKNKLKKIISR